MNIKLPLAFFAIACVSIGTAGKAAAAVIGLNVDGVSQKNPTNQPTVTGTGISVTGGIKHTAFDVKPFGPPYNYSSGRAGINVPAVGTGAGTVTALFTFNPFPSGAFRFDYYMSGLSNDNNPIIFPIAPDPNTNRNVCIITQDAVTGKYYGVTGGSFDTTTQTVGTAHVCRFTSIAITGPQSPSPVQADGAKRTAFQFFTDPSSTLNPNGTNSWSDIVMFNPVLTDNGGVQNDAAGGIFIVNGVPIDSLFNFNPGGN